MFSLPILLIAAACALALASLGGGLYEFSVVDPVWPRWPQIVQPGRGGMSRKRFWISAHVAFELCLIGSLVVAWRLPEVRDWLWIALASHGVMRLWSAFDFIPRALAFERADPETIDKNSARRWARRSRLRIPLDLVTCASLLIALVTAAKFSSI